eukprot:scaffold107570_cov20-Attheya_sp.AAC.1
MNHPLWNIMIQDSKVEFIPLQDLIYRQGAGDNNNSTSTTDINDAVQQVQGLSIIDDDLAVGVAADQTAREEVQAAFPPLSAASVENDDTNESNHDRHGV